VMSQAETMAMQGPPQWQPQGAMTMQRPMAGGPRPPERRSSSWVWAALAALGVLVVVVLAVALVLSRRDDKNPANQQAATTVQMPNLVGKTDAQARQLLSAQGLGQVTVDEPDKKKGCDGKVAEQTPTAGTQIKKADPVSYKLCVAPEKVEVPTDLIGATKDSAASRLRGLGLIPEFKSVSSLKPLNTVVEVEDDGKEVELGTTITVRISDAKVVKMPNVVGQTEDVARALLEDRGLNISRKTVVDPTKEPGTVASQQPKANSNVEKGDQITIVIVVEDPNQPRHPTPDPTDTNSPGIGGGQIVNGALPYVINRQD